MSESSGSGGAGFVSLLTVAFIVLKLTNVIEWGWFWVLSPMIFSFAIFLLVVLVALVVTLVKK